MLTVESVNKAADEFGFNCGPGALCAVLGMTPDQLRPHLLDFEAKRYTNPTLMAAILRSLGVPFRRVWECPVKADGRELDYPVVGLVRIQWAGPWTKPGVPMAARYRHTHWIGVRPSGEEVRQVFDVNCICVGGWVSWAEWTGRVVPWLLRECQPKATGEWWPTHCWEVKGA